MKKCRHQFVACDMLDLSYHIRNVSEIVCVWVCSVYVSLAFAYACTWWWIMIISHFQFAICKKPMLFILSIYSLSFFLWSPSTFAYYKLLTAACRLPVSNLYMMNTLVFPLFHCYVSMCCWDISNSLCITNSLCDNNQIHIYAPNTLFMMCILSHDITKTITSVVVVVVDAFRFYYLLHGKSNASSFQLPFTSSFMFVESVRILRTTSFSYLSKSDAKVSSFQFP